jgi:hypothetical protein
VKTRERVVMLNPPSADEESDRKARLFARAQSHRDYKERKCAGRDSSDLNFLRLSPLEDRECPIDLRYIEDDGSRLVPFGDRAVAVIDVDPGCPES